MPRALSVSLTAIAASTCLGLAAGCNGASPLAPAGDPIASPVAPQTHSGAANLGTPLAAGPGLAEAPLALYRLSLDPATLQGSFTPLAARGLQQTDDVFDLSVDNFLQAGSLTISRITANPRTVDITYRFTHPFRAPSDPTAPATAANRADLGIAGRVLFLADVTPGPDNTFFAGADPVILNSRLVTNADGYFAPKALLGLSGFGANTFPYKMLGDETYDPDTGFREGVSNGGDVTGNYDPMVGWQRDTLGPDNAGWTGYGVLHQGQVALNTISVSQEALREGERFDVDVAVLAKYADPRGGATGIEKRANRLPADPPDVSKFVYRMPHGALDVQRVTFLREDGTLLTNSNSTTRVRFHVEDWDARATETAEDDLANEPMASKVAKLESGVPTLEVSAPGIIGDASAVTIFDPATTLINDDSGFGGDAAADTGVPSDALFYRGTLTNTVTTGQVRGTSIAVVRAVDVEAGMDTASWRFALDPNLTLLATNLPLPVTYQIFPLSLGNTAPTLTLSLTSANILSGSTATLRVDAFNDPDGDPITVEIDWTNDGTFEDTRTLDPGDPNPEWVSPAPYNNSGFSPVNRTIAVRYSDGLVAPVAYTPAITFSVSANRRPVISGTPVLVPLAGGLFQITQGTATVTDPEGDPISFTVVNNINSERGGGSGFPVLANATPFANPPNDMVTFTLYANDPNHLGTSGAAFPALTAPVPRPGWGQRIGGYLSDSTTAVTVHPDGYLLAAGGFASTMSFGGPVRTPTNAAGWADGYLLALEFDGTYKWDKSWGGDGHDYISEIAIGPGGEIVLGGYTFSPSINLGGGVRPVAANSDAFALKLDRNGNYAWDYVAGGDNLDYASALAVDGAGRVFVGGNFHSSDINFGGGNRSAGGGKRMYVVGLSPTGGYLWDRTYGDADEATFEGLAASGDSVYAAGYFEGVVNFGSGARGNAGEYSGVLLRLGGVTGFWELDKVWPNSLAVGLAVDPSEPYVTVSGGYLAADVDFGGGPRDWAGGLDAFVVQYDHSGHYRWDHTWGSAGQDSMNGLAVDADGNLYGAGAISGATDFGGGPRPTAGSTTRYLARFDLAGTYAWDATWGVASGDFNSGPPAVGAGLAFFIGSATAAIDADPGAGTLTLLPRGDYDGVLVALNANTGRF